MKKVGRNEPCPCGSGKKYKMCCLGEYVYKDEDAEPVKKKSHLGTRLLLSALAGMGIPIGRKKKMTTTPKPKIHLNNGSEIECDAVQFKSMGNLQIVVATNPKDLKSKIKITMPVMVFPMGNVIGVGLAKEDARAQMQDPEGH